MSEVPVQALIDRASALTPVFIGAEARRNALGEQLASQRATMQGIADRKAHNLKAVAVLDALIQRVAEQGVGRVESVVTQGLQLVFGEGTACVLEKKEGARGTTYRINIQFGDIVGDPMDDFGGGPVNVTSFLLRVLMLHRFGLSKILVLDESFNNVSESYLPKVSVLLKSLVEDFGFKVLAITHQPSLATHADHAYRVGGEIGRPTLQLLEQGDES